MRKRTVGGRGLRDGLAIVNAISAEINSRKSQEEILPIIAREMVGTVDGINHATITLLDPSHDFYQVVAEHPRLIGNLPNARLRIRDRPLQEALLRNKQPIVVNNVAKHRLATESPELTNIAGKYGIKSMLIVPMVYKDEVIGTVSVDALNERKTFDDDEIALYRTIANQAAIAIENARSFTRERDLNETIARFNQSLRLQDLIGHMFQELRSITSYKRASIQVLQGHKRILVGASGFDANNVDRRLLRPVNKDALVKGVLEKGAVKIIPDTRKAGKLWKPLAGTRQVHSWVGVPLLHDGKPIGLITLDDDKAEVFGHGLAARLADFARYAASALRKAYQYEQAEKQAQAVDALNKVMRVLPDLDSTDRLFKIACEGAIEILHCGRCDLWLLEDDGGKDVLRLQASSAGNPRAATLPIDGDGPARSPLLSALTGSLLSEDAREEYANRAGAERREKPRALVVAPIVVGDQNIGVLCASHDRAAWFAEADRKLLETLALSVGTAIRRLVSTALLRTISEGLMRAEGLESVMNEIVTGAKEVTYAKSGVIFLLDDDGERITAAFTASGTEHPVPRLTNANGITRTVIRDKEIIYIPDIRKDARVNPALVQAGYLSMIAVPLLLGNRVTGVLYLNDDTAHHFSDHERSLLMTLANHAAVAIEKARLHQIAQASGARYTSLVENIPVSLFRKDRDLRFTFVNPAFCRFLKLADGKEVLGKTNFDLFRGAPDIAESFANDDRRVLHEGEHVQRTCDLPGFGTVKVLKNAIRDAGGKVCEIQGMFLDVTSDKQMIERVKAALLERLEIGIILWKDGRIVSANGRARTMLGLDRDEIADKQIEEIVPRSERQRFLAEVAARPDGVPKDHRFRTKLQKNGKTIGVTVSVHPVPDTGEVEIVLLPEPSGGRAGRRT